MLCRLGPTSQVLVRQSGIHIDHIEVIFPSTCWMPKQGDKVGGYLQIQVGILTLLKFRFCMRVCILFKRPVVCMVKLVKYKSLFLLHNMGGRLLQTSPMIGEEL